MFGTHDDDTERFAPTNGRAAGVLGLLISLGFAVGGLVETDTGIAAWGVALAVFGGSVSWAALLRPRVSMDAESLTLRGMVDTVVLPLARVESVVVQQYMAVGVDGKRYVSPAVARNRRQQRRDEKTGGDGAPGGAGRAGSMPTSLFSAPRIFREDSGGAPSRAVAAGGGRSYGYYVESKVQAAVAEAQRRRSRAVAGADVTEQPVVRRLAWAEIAALSISAVATVVLLLV